MFSLKPTLLFFLSQICRDQRMMDKANDWKTTKVITEDQAITNKSKQLIAIFIEKMLKN